MYDNKALREIAGWFEINADRRLIQGALRHYPQVSIFKIKSGALTDQTDRSIGRSSIMK